MSLFSFLSHSKEPTEDNSVIPDETKESQSLLLSDETFTRLRDFIYKNCGIYYKDNKRGLLENRISGRLKHHKLGSFASYLDLLNQPDGRDELNLLIDAITINETYFFRDMPQFDILEKFVIPEIISKSKSGKNPILRIWSCASSTGEEAYTIAIIVMERLREKFPGITFQILASDINNHALDSARKGIYPEYSVRMVPPDILGKYFTESGTATYTLGDEVRKLVRFTNINLYDPKQMDKIRGCDVIFCSNVLIYFNQPSKQQVLAYIYNSLNPGGYLFTGYCESLHGTDHSFRLLHYPKALVYKKD